MFKSGFNNTVVAEVKDMTSPWGRDHRLPGWFVNLHSYF